MPGGDDNLFLYDEPRALSPIERDYEVGMAGKGIWRHPDGDGRFRCPLQIANVRVPATGIEILGWPSGSCPMCYSDVPIKPETIGSDGYAMLPNHFTTGEPT